MATLNSQGKDADLSRGQSAENRFTREALARGWRVRQANKQEEMHGHFDFVLSKENGDLKVEVKSQKSFPVLVNGQWSQDFVLVEFAGITGEMGWLFGEAHVVAFETPRGFLMADRAKLAKLATDLVERKPALRREDMHKRIYRRTGRLDEVSALSYKEISGVSVLWKFSA
jgi:hypothetical protein